MLRISALNIEKLSQSDQLYLLNACLSVADKRLRGLTDPEAAGFALRQKLDPSVWFVYEGGHQLRIKKISESCHYNIILIDSDDECFLWGAGVPQHLRFELSPGMLNYHG